MAEPVKSHQLKNDQPIQLKSGEVFISPETTQMFPLHEEYDHCSRLFHFQMPQLPITQPGPATYAHSSHSALY